MKKAGILLYAAAAAVFAAATALLCAMIPSAGTLEVWAAVSAGASAMLFAALCAVLLADIAAGRRRIGPALLALLAGVTAFWQLAFYFGEGLLPQWARGLAASPWFGIIPLALTAAYILLNRGRSFFQYFGAALLTLGAAAGISYLVLWLIKSPLAGALGDTVVLSLRGEAPMAWLYQYLGLVCCGGGLGLSLREYGELRRRLEELSVREAMLTESYHRMADSIKETSIMRHDWKNQISGFRVLAQMGDTQRLVRALKKADAQLSRLSLREFSKNFTVNVILQNAAARAADAGITFSALAPLPEELGIDSADLCSLLINMMDNALAAAAKAPEGAREVSASLRLNQGFLAIMCQNTYAGEIRINTQGEPTQPPEGGEPGFGIRRMRQIAKKYGGVLELDWTGGEFTVQTALNLE